MKKGIVRVLILVLVGCFLLSGGHALASDISGALYSAIISIGNSGGAEATDVCTTVDISTPSLIASGSSNTTATNMVMRNSTGADTLFMPGYDTNPWVMWVESLSAHSYTNYLLYTAESTGGEIRYFPNTGGMTASDNVTLELGDTFIIEQKGRVDTSAGADKNLVYKNGSFRTYISANQQITSELASLAYYTPTGHNDPGTDWINEVGAYDDNTGTFSQTSTSIPINSWGDYLELTIGATSVNTLAFYAKYVAAEINEIDLDVYYSGAWHDVYQGAYTNQEWVEKAIPAGEQTVTVARAKFYNDDDVTAHKAYVYEFKFKGGALVSATATGITSGLRKVVTEADGTDMVISVYNEDDNLIDDGTVALAGVSAYDNDNNWVFLENDVMPYMDYHKVWVSGALKQHIEWEYDDEFTDQSGNGNHATPTFRTTSSDEDVSGTVISFLPVSEAKAPAFFLGDTLPWITEAPPVSGNFTTEIMPTFPGAEIITAVAEESDTPSQLPLTIIAGFTILAVSLSVSGFTKRAGSNSLLLKSILIGSLMGIAIATNIMDFWMLLFFAIIAVALAMGSQQKGWV